MNMVRSNLVFFAIMIVAVSCPLAQASPMLLEEAMTLASLIEGSHGILSGIYGYFGYSGSPWVDFTISYGPSGNTYTTGLNSYIWTEPVERNLPLGGSIPVSFWALNLTGSGTLNGPPDGRNLTWSASWIGTLEPVLSDAETILISGTDTATWVADLEKSEYVSLDFQQNGQLQGSKLKEYILGFAEACVGCKFPNVAAQCVLISTGDLLIEEIIEEITLKISICQNGVATSEHKSEKYDLYDFIIMVDQNRWHGVTSASPEPATLGLLALGGMGALLRRRKSKA